jgi:hypothetical protein
MSLASRRPRACALPGAPVAHGDGGKTDGERPVAAKHAGDRTVEQINRALTEVFSCFAVVRYELPEGLGFQAGEGTAIEPSPTRGRAEKVRADAASRFRTQAGRRR